MGALGLVTNAVVLWNTIYMQAALDHLRNEGETINEEDEARLSPLKKAEETDEKRSAYISTNGPILIYRFTQD